MGVTIFFVLAALGRRDLHAAARPDLPPAACVAAQRPCEPSNEDDSFLQLTSSQRSEGSGKTEVEMARDDDAASSIQWGDQIALSITHHGGTTDNCGWYGCRVAYMDENRVMKFGHGSALDGNASRFGQKPGGFYVRPHPSSKGKSGCVKWGDQIALSITYHGGTTFNCGWYGCRVAYMDEDKVMKFGHGSALDGDASRFGQKPGGFYVRPHPSSKGKSGCVKWGDQIALSITYHGGTTGNCGWYGCRVAYMDENKVMKFGHGSALDGDTSEYGQKPGGFYVRPHPLQQYCATVERCGVIGDGDDVRSCASEKKCAKGSRVEAAALARDAASAKAEAQAKAEASKAITVEDKGVVAS